MGEPAYNAARLRTAIQWIRSRPGDFLRLTGERIFLFWFPLRSTFVSTSIGALQSLAGLCGLVLLLVQRRAQAWLFAGMLLGYFPVFALLATDPRYSYPIEPLLLLLAGFFVTSSLTKIFSRGAPSMQQNVASEAFLPEEVR